MAGHSKWANIRIRKGAQDAKRGKMFTKAAKEIIIAAKAGGDPDKNPRLRTAIAAARGVNMPNDKIDNAIKKGTGELQSDALEEITYEGYGPGGVAVFLDVTTDNRNRTVGELRHILSKAGGSLGESGSVGWMFERLGVLTFAKEAASEDDLLEAGMEAGADDVIDDGDYWEVRCAMEDFHTVQAAYEAAGLTPESAKLAMVPSNVMDLDAEAARKILRMIDALEENDDVQDVWTNMEVSDAVMAELEADD